ncbi:hypothetical protein KP509_24G002300 [Ceratopteris richardii]|uniref:Uncharacterized protein n=1 Tax=Ceratopteris richardii TaxID=49495 RepID=A0A8T2RU36_CERRI|nr:hypothetical protein KP509_24G002300 [Ceratopteris richardii]
MFRSCKWWNEETVAVVTGASKGIGFDVCRQFASVGLHVILTARDAEKGLKAAGVLKNEGFQNISFHQLDVTDERSCAALASWIFQEQGAIDVLVNNAAINGLLIDEAYVEKNNLKFQDLMNEEHNSKAFIIEYESAKACIDTNYYGTKYVTQALLPLLRFAAHGARIVNVGSSFGQLNISWEGKGWPQKFPSYKMSKIALHAYTRLLAMQMEKRNLLGMKVFVNCVHPGFVRTDLSSGRGNLSAHEGAENVVLLALLPPEDCPSGQFFFEKKLGVF